MSEGKESYTTKDKSGNGINDSTDAKLRYVAGYYLLIFAAVGFFFAGMDTRAVVACVTFGSILVGEQKAGSIVEAIKNR